MKERTAQTFSNNLYYYIEAHKLAVLQGGCVCRPEPCDQGIGPMSLCVYLDLALVQNKVGASSAVHFLECFKLQWHHAAGVACSHH